VAAARARRCSSGYAANRPVAGTTRAGEGQSQGPSAGPGSATELDRALAGETRALARLISLVEDGAPSVRSVIKELLPSTGSARIIGLTGSPGVGKSTVTGALVGAFRTAGCRVAVLAVDPTSPFTGGALLGDRVRMQDHATDDQVFIRSMASRGHLGGLAASTPQAIRVLDAAGFDVIVIETVGVGQAEVAIASLADSVVVLLAPGMGDAIQAAKAGILEVADLFVVNKADKPDSQLVVRDLRNMIALTQRQPGDWKPPILTTVAMKGEGIDELVSHLDAHWSWLNSGGNLGKRRQARAREEITALAFARLRGRLAASRLDELARQVADGSIDPFQAADELLSQHAG
jgi:LAO/AO transport system kinase